MISVPFTFLRARPDTARGEQLNIGLVAFFPSGPSVRLEVPSWRLRALHPNFDLVDWNEWGMELEVALLGLESTEQRWLWLKGGLGSVVADASMGRIQGTSEKDVHRLIDELIDKMVRVPERTLAIQSGNQKIRTKLHSQLRTWFRASQIFSSRVSDLSNHKVVPSYPVDAADDLYADFALRNGAIHIIETLDFRGVDRLNKAVRGEASVTAILFDQARTLLTVDCKRIAVTAADDYGVVKPLIGLINKYADDVIALESSNDRQRLADFVAASLKVQPGLEPIAA